MEERLRSFGAAVAAIVDPAVDIVERHRELPAYRPFDGVGTPIESIEFHPAHIEAGRAVWGSGIADDDKPGGLFAQAALFYLLSHVGEGGHACPLVCTVGMARALRHRGSTDLVEKHLAGLVSSDYDTAVRGSQFLTEVQGGSDVGSNAAEAVADPDEAGAWRISGEKWFCSVADAGLFAVTARPVGAGPGTKGLGCFLVPRTIAGVPNGFRIRRLKDKLGTRGLASAEIDFDNALAWPIGEIDEGFKVAVGELLNTSRWLNAIGSTGLMRRAVIEASSFARHRTAFGRPIGSFPLVREQLALMKVEEQAALASTMLLTRLVEAVDTGVASDAERASHRFLVNANKYVTSIAASDVVHGAIEALGGNGTIEDFSPLPRLYRDAIVYESWEGTHNVLCAQVQRDCARLELLDPVVESIHAELARAGHVSGDDVKVVLAALDRVEQRLRRSIPAGEPAAADFRRQLGSIVRVIQAAALLGEADGEADGDGAMREEKAAVAGVFIRRHLLPGHEPEDDDSWSSLVEAALAGDAG